MLTGRGIEVYFPTVPAPGRLHRSARRAFFPCYLFVQTDLETAGLWPLHYAPGVRGVVMFGGVPARVAGNLIDALRNRLERADVVDVDGKMLEPGDRVFITAGPLAELEGVFDQRLSAAGRVRVLIRLLQRWTVVETDAKMLRKTSGMPRRDLLSAPARL